MPIGKRVTFLDLDRIFSGVHEYTDYHYGRNVGLRPGGGGDFLYSVTNGSVHLGCTLTDWHMVGDAPASETGRTSRKIGDASFFEDGGQLAYRRYNVNARFQIGPELRDGQMLVPQELRCGGRYGGAADPRCGPGSSGSRAGCCPTPRASFCGGGRSLSFLVWHLCRGAGPTCAPDPGVSQRSTPGYLLQPLAGWKRSDAASSKAPPGVGRAIGVDASRRLARR